jgi:hypothetical protein
VLTTILKRMNEKERGGEKGAGVFFKNYAIACGKRLS